MQAIVNYLIKGTNLVVGDSQAPFDKAIFKGALVAATTNAAGGVLTLQNTTGYDLYVDVCMLDVTTGSTGAAVLAVGVADTVASDNSLLDAANAQTVEIISNLVGGGTAGKHARWKNGKYLTITASATTVGMVGAYFIRTYPV